MHAMVLFQKRDMNSIKNFMTKKVKSRRRKKEGIDELMTDLTNRHDAAAAILLTL